MRCLAMRKSPISSFLSSVLRGEWLWICIAQVAHLAWSFETVVYPSFSGQIVDILSNFSGDRSKIWGAIKYPVMQFAAIFFILEFCFRVGGFLFAKRMPSLEAKVRMTLVKDVQKKPFGYFKNNLAGDILNKISDMARSLGIMLQLSIKMFVPVFVALVLVAGVFWKVHWSIAVLMFLWVSVHISLCIAFSFRAAKLSRDHASARSSLHGEIIDSISNYMSVKLFAKEDYEISYLSNKQNEERKKNVKHLAYNEYVKIVLSLLAFLIPLGLLNGISFYFWMNNILSVGDVVVVMQTSLHMTFFVWVVGSQIPDFVKEIGVSLQASALLEGEVVEDAPDARPLRVTEGLITLQNVSFKYDTDVEPFFEDLSLTIEPGQHVGLVGYSGSGKSTLFNLILKFLNPQSGAILIDGQDIADVTLKSLRNAIGVVPQDPILFNRSIKDNIRYAKIQASDEEIVLASQSAHIHSKIISLPDGYESSAGERGSRLSGGERQRVAMARLAVIKTGIVMLDEATSAQDALTDSHIQHSLEEITKNRTTFIIAHRLRTIVNMDRILVFDRGKIVQDGPHEHLIHQDGLYQKLWRAQTHGFMPDTPPDEEEGL